MSLAGRLGTGTLAALICVAGSLAMAQERRQPPRPADNSALIAATAEAAVGCIVAATTSGVDGGSFANNAEWVATTEPQGFRHATMPVVITIPSVGDGQPPQCLVEATLASQYDQSQLATALRALLPIPATTEGEITMWRMGRSPGGRSLQMVRDPQSPQPVIRFVGQGF